MTRCKPGDLAWMHVTDFPQNYGVVVTVVERGVGRSAPAWIVRTHGRPIVGEDNTTGELCMHARAVVPDRWLTPITGTTSATDDVPQAAAA